MSCVCIVDESNIKAFSSDGEDFIASLQFKVNSELSLLVLWHPAILLYCNQGVCIY